MIVIHALQHARILVAGIFSITALSLMAFQSVEITQAFMAFFSDYFHKD
ncbi:hypothetical protein [Salibacterium salarium]|nr:hypothetical protein [Salibacterium salarium]